MKMKNNKSQKNIPDGWEKVKLGDIGKVSMCKRIFKHETLPSGPVPFYKISTFGKIADSFISEDLFEKYKNKYSYPKKSEILISASGTIGRTVVFDGGKSYFQDSNIVWIANPQDKVLNKFLGYVYLRTKWISTDGGIISRLYNENLRSIQFNLPPLPEQKRIVSVLETWDQMIEKLARKIEIKKSVKKGLMQNLLTGKVRLAGFKDEWKLVKLGDVGEIVTGNTPPMKDKNNYGETYCWATAEDFNGKYINSTRIKLSEDGKKISRFLPKGSILVTCIASIGKNAIAGVPLATNQQINSIVVNKKNNNEFIYYVIQNSKNLLKRFAGAGAMPILNKITFSKIKILIPELEEQKAIADILMTSDSEIKMLEKKLSIIKNQKKYLLDNLVTGQIRVPEFKK
jgi:type I restriction enzyme S subunit